jgi:hypothetical protein
MRVRARLAFAVMLVAGCGSAAPATRGKVAASAPETFQSRTSFFLPPRVDEHAAPRDDGDARPARKAALHFELHGREFPLPLLHGTVGGQPTWMLVDSGANSHVIAQWLAKKAKLALRPLGEVGTDHTGRAVMTYSADEPRVTVDGWGALAEGPMLVTEVPAAIEELGIGAFISPQWLGEDDEGVVVDFVHGTVSAAPFDDAVRGLAGRGRDLAPAGGKLCEDIGSPIRGLGFVIPASVEGNAVQLLLDTGAYRTDLLTSAGAGKRLASRSVANREQMYAASGLVHTRLVKAAHVAVGAFSIVSDVELVPGSADPACPRDGVVSMDVLKSCVVVLGRKQMTGRCGDAG